MSYSDSSLAYRIASIEEEIRELKDMVSECANLSAVLESLQDALANKLDDIFDKLQENIRNINGQIAVGIGGVSRLVEEQSSQQNKYYADIKQTLEGIRRDFIGRFQESMRALSNISDLVDEGFKSVEESIRKVGESQAKEMENIQRLMRENTQKILSNITETHQEDIKKLDKIIEILDGKIFNLLEIDSKLSDAGKMLADLSQSLRILHNNLADLTEFIKNIYQNMEEHNSRIEKTLDNSFTQIKDLAKNEYNNIFALITQYSNKIDFKLNENYNNISNKFDDVRKSIIGTLTNLIQSVDALITAVQETQLLFEEARADILNEFRANLALFEDYGRIFMEMLEK